MIGRNSDLLQIIDSFADRKVLVIGEGMLDVYMRGTSERLCQEAPVPIVDIQETQYMPGGAANTAVNLSSLGASVTFLSVVGDDEEGHKLIQCLAQHHVSTEHILTSPSRITLAKQRIISGSQIVVRFDQGSSTPVEAAIEASFIERLKLLFSTHEAIVISDYNHGIMTPRVIQILAELQRDDPRVLVVDSKQLPAYRNLNMTAAKLNYEECLEFLDLLKLHTEEDRIQQVLEHGRRTFDLIPAQIVSITLDQSGALIFRSEEEAPYRTYAQPQPNTQTAGAGDTFASALTMSLTVGADVEHAAEIASAAASVAVSRNGTTVCSTDELKEHFAATEKIIADIFQLTLRVALYRKSGRKIIFTNGCFDILHRGHIAYLNRAKALGDILIVGLNSDQSVQKVKGPERPINSLEERSQVLAALSCVDHIVPFDDALPHSLIRHIAPDIFVKGGDYTRETLPEATLVEELGGEVQILPYLENYSTSNVIEKIRNLLEKNSLKE